MGEGLGWWLLLLLLVPCGWLLARGLPPWLDTGLLSCWFERSDADDAGLLEPLLR
jgi:hypothetical protein